VAVGGVLNEDVTADELKKKLEELSTNTVTEDRSG